MSTRSGDTFQGASDASLTDDALPATSDAPPAAKDDPRAACLSPKERRDLLPPVLPTLPVISPGTSQASQADHRSSGGDHRTSGKQPTFSDINSAAHRSSPGATQASQADHRTSGVDNRTSSKQSSESDSSSSASGGKVAELSQNVDALQKTVERLADTLALAIQSGDDIPAPTGTLHSVNLPAFLPVHGDKAGPTDGRGRGCVPGVLPSSAGSVFGSYQAGLPPLHGGDSNRTLLPGTYNGNKTQTQACTACLHGRATGTHIPCVPRRAAQGTSNGSLSL